MIEQEPSYTEVFLKNIRKMAKLEDMNLSMQNISYNDFMSLERFLNDHGSTLNNLVIALIDNPFDDTCAVKKDESDEERKKRAYEAKRKQVKDRWAKNVAIPRDYGFQICLLMDWDRETSAMFMDKVCAEPWIHWRNYREVIYDYCIHNRQGIQKAFALYKDFKKRLLNFFGTGREEIISKYNDLSKTCIGKTESEKRLKLKRLMEADFLPNYFQAVDGYKDLEPASFVMTEDKLLHLVPNMEQAITDFLENNSFSRNFGREGKKDELKKELLTSRTRLLQFCLYHELSVTIIISKLGENVWNNLSGCYSAIDVLLRFCIEQDINIKDAYMTWNDIQKTQRQLACSYTLLNKSNLEGKSKSDEEFLVLMESHIKMFSERRQTILSEFRKLVDGAPNHDRYYIKRPSDERVNGWFDYFPVERLLELKDVIEENTDRKRGENFDPLESLQQRMRQWYEGYKHNDLPKREDFILCLLLIGVNNSVNIDDLLKECGYTMLYARRHFDYVVLCLLERDDSKYADFKDLSTTFCNFWFDFQNNREEYQLHTALRDAINQYMNSFKRAKGRMDEYYPKAAVTCVNKCLKVFQTEALTDASKNKVRERINQLGDTILDSYKKKALLSEIDENKIREKVIQDILTITQ